MGLQDIKRGASLDIDWDRVVKDLNQAQEVLTRVDGLRIDQRGSISWKDLDDRSELCLVKAFQNSIVVRLVMADLEVTENVPYAKQVLLVGQSSMATLMEAHGFLVSRIGKKLQDLCSPGFDEEDLLQEGRIGLIVAAARFDETKGAKFVTYATYWVLNSVVRALHDQGRLIRLPVGLSHAVNECSDDSALSDIDFNERVDALALKHKVNPATLKEMCRLAQTPESFDAPLSRKDNHTWKPSDLYDVEPHEGPSPEDLALERDLERWINSMLIELNPRDAEIVRLALGMGDVEPSSYQEIADITGITRQRVHQIVSPAIKRIRAALAIRENLSR